MAKFARGNKVIVVKQSSVFFGRSGIIDSVPSCTLIQIYWVRFADFDNRPIHFEETELARVV